MSATKIREGKTRTQVFSTVLAFQQERDIHPRQQDIVEETPVSKGAVSNHVSSLVDLGLLTEAGAGAYAVDEDRLKEEYREHVEATLTREEAAPPFEDRVKAHNEIRTRTKRNLDDVINSRVVRAALIVAFLESRESRRIQTFREVFLRTDEIIRAVATDAVEHGINEVLVDIHEEDIDAMFLLAVSLNNTHQQVAGVAERVPSFEKFIPGEVPTESMIDYLQNKEK